MFSFQLMFASIVSSGGGTALWQPNADVLILQVDANTAIALSLSPTIVYPNGTTDSLAFVCSQAGRFDCGLMVKAGSNLFAVRSGLGGYIISLAYQVQTADPAPIS